MRKLAVLLLLLVPAVPAAAAVSVGFTPKTIAGNWAGTWTNERFGSSGAATFTAKANPKNTTLTFTVDFGGNVFGCADPPGEGTPPLAKGAGPNHWNAAGFQLKGSSKAFGDLTLTYSFAKKTLVGSGANAHCAPGLSWALSGTFSGASFTGKVNITLADGTTAVSDLSLTRH